VIEPDGEKALDEVVEGDSVEDEAEDQVKGSQQSVESPIRQPESSVSREGISVGEGLGSSIGRVEDAKSGEDDVLGKEEEQEDAQTTDDTNSTSKDLLGVSVELFSNHLDGGFTFESFQLESEDDIIESTKNFLKSSFHVVSRRGLE